MSFVTLDTLAKTLADKSNVDFKTAKEILKSIEPSLIEIFSGIEPHENVTLKICNGLILEREYIEPREMTGLFKGQTSNEHTTVNVRVGKNFKNKINSNLFGE